jgi:hypothetical protein
MVVFSSVVSRFPLLRIPAFERLGFGGRKQGGNREYSKQKERKRMKNEKCLRVVATWIIYAIISDLGHYLLPAWPQRDATWDLIMYRVL